MPTPNQLTRAYATFWEFLCRRYPARDHLYNTQFYPVSFAVATTGLPQGLIQVQYPAFMFEFRTKGFTATGGNPGVPYEVGLSMQSGSDWLSSIQPGGGQALSELWTGDFRGAVGTQLNFTFAWPRECPPNTNLTVTINNSFAGSAAITVHASLIGIEVRKRPPGHREAMQMR